jgi:hypothetical protein
MRGSNPTSSSAGACFLSARLGVTLDLAIPTTGCDAGEGAGIRLLVHVTGKDIGM